MDIVPLLTQLWPPFGTELLGVTAGGLLVVALWIVVGGALAAYSGRVVVAYEKARGIHDEQVQNVSRTLLSVTIASASLLVGLDMGGVVSVVASTAWLTSVLGFPLLYRKDVAITLGGVLAVGLFVFFGRKLSGWVSQGLLQLAQERGGVEDERVQRLISQTSETIVILASLGIGLDVGGMVNIGDSVSAFFSLFTSGLFQIGDHDVTFSTLVTIAAIIVGSFYLSRMVRAALRPALELRLSQPGDDGTISVIERLTHYLIVAIGVVIALQTGGIDLSALLATGAAFAVGLSLAMQSMAQNMISGLILLLERAIKPGDILELDGEPVRVIRIGLRSTVVKTLNDEDRIVPNASLVDSAITNYSYSDQNLRIRAMVGVSYESDLDVVHAALTEAAQSVDLLPEFKPRILLTDFGASSVDFEVSVWIRDPWRLYEVASELRLSIWWKLKAAGVSIAYPQLDVHFDSAKPEPPPLSFVREEGAD